MSSRYTTDLPKKLSNACLESNIWILLCPSTKMPSVNTIIYRLSTEIKRHTVVAT